MKKAIKILLCILLFWFALDAMGFAVGKLCLVESTGILSVDTAWWAIFVVFSVLFFLREGQGKYVLTVFLAAWTIIQYTSHWMYTIFGATQRKLDGYNKYFANTYHIIPTSNNILIPDLYHIVLHILIVSLLVLMIIYIMKDRAKKFLTSENKFKIKA